MCDWSNSTCRSTTHTGCGISSQPEEVWVAQNKELAVHRAGSRVAEGSDLAAAALRQ